ncbi:jg6950 [Pararge aegeria aegeria]|uniref:Jg6950 protein n=1 Tax=Pararge aegeria aegeria TaxID=348720 RepID=A0A8S4S176_9NEOP|nr:jg6950 [Pararge aegeria aegeria]
MDHDSISKVRSPLRWLNADWWTSHAFENTEACRIPHDVYTPISDRLTTVKSKSLPTLSLKSNGAEVRVLAEAPSGLPRVSHFPPDVVEPWGSSHDELSPHSPGDAVATPQVVIGKCPSEN